MPPRPPILDSRALNDILRQLQHEARNDVPEWEPPPAGDAGTMLQRIFARLLEIVLQRLNQVPEKNLLAFLDTMGVSLLPPSPAQVPLTFVLTPGSPPTFVPQGTQAGTQPSGQQPAVIFETVDDLTVIPAQLTQGFTMDPTWDRYTDHTPALGGESPSGFTPFVGKKANHHVLYLGGQEIFLLSQPSTISFLFNLASGLQAMDFLELFRSLLWELWVGGHWIAFPFAPVVSSLGTQNVSVQFDHVSHIDSQPLQGPGLTPPITARWVRATLTTPIGESDVAQRLQLAPQIAGAETAIRPDDGYAERVNPDAKVPPQQAGQRLDFSKTEEFRPFGDGTINKEFWLSSAEGLDKDNVVVEISFDLAIPGVRATTPLLIEWAYWQDGLWLELDPQDETQAFTRSGRVRFPHPGHLDQVNTPSADVFARAWIRARIFQGHYERAPAIRSVLFHRGIPVDKAFINTTPADVTKGVSPFGERPKPQDTFYLASDEAFSKQFGATTLHIRLHQAVSRVDNLQVIWEYQAVNRWQAIPNISDSTHNLTTNGVVQFPLPPDRTQSEVHGQMGYWIRARLASGNYGVEAVYDPIPNNPSGGFQLRQGTGVFDPPLIASLTIAYSATELLSAVTENALAFDDIGVQPGKSPQFTRVFQAMDEQVPTFYLGFDSAFPEQPITLYVAAAPRIFTGSIVKEARATSALSSALPPLAWEYFNGTTWRDLPIFDGTNNLTESGTVEFLTPTDIASLAKFDLTPRYWIRARSPTNDAFDTQLLAGVFLNTIPAMQAETIQNETLASSNGQPNQTVHCTRTPVLSGQQVMVREPEPPSDQERTAIDEEEGKDAVQERIDPVTGEAEVLVRWHEVANFVASDPHSRHYTLDHTSGLVTFGDGKRGLIPPPGTNNVIATYRTGGGRAGNVPKGVIAQVKSPLPGIGAVTNPVASDGGAEVETLSMVEDRGPQTLKHRGRAVAAGDFEWLARQAVGTRVARVKCLPNVNRDLHFEPGWVTLLVVPQGAEGRLSPSSELIRELEDSLEARAFVGLARSTPARLNVIGPGYIQVTVVAQIVPQDMDEAEAVKQKVRAALDTFLHPLRGGPNGTGWVFGRDVYESEVYKVIEDVPGVSHVKTLSLIANLAQRRLIVSSPPRTALALPEHSLVRTNNRQKAALLAEPVPVGTPVDHIAVKGFTEGDRITKVLDLTTPRPSGTTIAVDVFVSDAAGFPRGSIVMTFDGRLRTRLAASIPGSKSGLTRIVVEDAEFAGHLHTADVLTVLYPFAMTVRAVSVENGHQILTIDPYETNVAFLPDTTVLATLDNCVRLPLHTEIQGNQLVTVITLRDFRPGEELFILPHGSGEAEGAIKLTIQAVEPVTHIVYLDDNFLVYPGVHRLTMVSDAEAAS